LKKFIALLIAIAIASACLGYSSANLPSTPTSTPSPAFSFVPQASAAAPIAPALPSTPNAERTLRLKLPAASEDGGVLAELSVTARQAAQTPARTWIPVPDPSNPIVNNDTQVSLGLAADYARLHATIDNSETDLFYSLNAPSIAVGGRSAGAAAAIAALAVLDGKRLRNDTLVTGSIEPDGRITRVGRVLDKARASARGGYLVLLVPIGEATELVETTISNRSCTTDYVDGTPFSSCRTRSETVYTEVNISNETGLQVIEVANVAQAYLLMLEQTMD